MRTPSKAGPFRETMLKINQQRMENQETKSARISQTSRAESQSLPLGIKALEADGKIPRIQDAKQKTNKQATFPSQ